MTQASFLWAVIAVGGVAGMWRCFVAPAEVGHDRRVSVFERSVSALVVGLPVGAAAGLVVASLLAVVLGP